MYAAVGQPQAVVDAAVQRLRDTGADARTAVVAAPEGCSAAEELLAIFTAFSVAETLRDAGEDVLLLIDDFTAVSSFWDEMVAMDPDPEQPEGEELDEERLVEYEGMLVSANSAQRRRFFSTTLQRAAQMNDKLGGGSLTLLAVCPAAAGAYNFRGSAAAAPKLPTADDVAKYEHLSEEQRAKLLAALQARAAEAATAAAEEDGPAARPALSRGIIEEFMSISDGQVVLRGLDEGAGWLPATEITISRLGLAATSPLLRALGLMSVRLDLQQADDGAAFSSHADEQAKEAGRADVVRAVLAQRAGEPVSPAETAALVYAVSKGALLGLAPEELERAVAAFRNADLSALEGATELTEEVNAALQAAVASAAA